MEDRPSAGSWDETNRVQDMIDEFTIESRTAEAIVVLHVAHGHRYAFHVTGEPHRRLLCVGPLQSNGKTSLPRSAFQRAARAFAEREARKAGMIDCG
jgi:hypothetical protein